MLAKPPPIGVQQSGIEPRVSQGHRVLIVDDSAVARAVITRILKEAGTFQVVGQAASAEEAFQMLGQVHPDIILLDVEMPGTSGIDAIPQLLEMSGNVPILILSSHCQETAEASIRAMTLGASDTLLKPGSHNFSGEFSKTLTDMMHAVIEARVLVPGSFKTPIGKDLPTAAPLRCLAVGASTGGLHALTDFFKTLPAQVDFPILVTQHLPPDFIGHFVNRMNHVTGRVFRKALDGEDLQPGGVYVAPGDAHFGIMGSLRKPQIKLRHRKTDNGHCPSVDVMMDDVAAVFGNSAIGVMCSGMGRDGSEGAANIVRAGGEILAQDQSSSTVWGMPGAVIEMGLATHVGTPAALARYVGRRCGAPA